MKAVVAAFNQEKALVGAFSVITNLRMELFEALLVTNLLLGSGAMTRENMETAAQTFRHEVTSRGDLKEIHVLGSEMYRWSA